MHRTLRAAAIVSAVGVLNRNTFCASEQRKEPKVAAVRRIQHGDKIVHFVRHAEGEHNVAGREDPLKGYLRPELEDAVLTKHGINQCKNLHKSTVDKLQSVELLVVSPMNRTIQTAMHSFPQFVDALPWVAIENVREQTGLHPCDKRKPISVHKANYGHVNFDLIASNEDPIYSKYILREPDTDVAARGREFIEWLKQRPEKEIIVVTHSAYLRHLFNRVLDIESDADREHFENCEMRTYILRGD